MFIQALKDFFIRYITVWRNTWAVRDQLTPPKRTKEELAFLPAHLELTDTPVSRSSKWTARIIMIFVPICFAMVLGWTD